MLPCFLQIQSPGSFLSVMIVDIISRKLPMASMLFTSYVFLILLIFSQMDILTRVSLFGAWFCISASFTILYIYAPETSLPEEMHHNNTIPPSFHFMECSKTVHAKDVYHIAQ